MKKTKKWEKFIYVSNKMKEYMKYYKLELKCEKMYLEQWNILQNVLQNAKI